MNLIECNEGRSAEILAILNDAIVNTTALYDYKPRTLEMMAAWFDAKRRGNYPVIGVTTDSGDLMGYASYGPFRAWPAYKYTVEHSLYVAQPYRRLGVGSRLLKALIERATVQNYHTVIGGIDSANTASIVLHERFGFEHVAMFREVGFKFGNWLNLCFYQFLLSTPHAPVDG